MKKILNFLLATILFIPIMVNAAECDTSKVYIDSISIDTNNKVEEIEEATAKDKKVNLNLRMAKQNDEILYKVVLKNDSSEDYEINKNSIVLNSDYIEYSLESDNDNIIKANSSRTIYLRVQYKTPVDPSKFVNGVYQDNITMKVSLRSDDTPENPKTGLPYVIIISLILIISGLSLIIFKKKKLSTLMILVGLILLPVGVKALCTCEILVDSKVQIVKGDTFCTYNRGIESEEATINYYVYIEDETFTQYLERDPSKYNELGFNKSIRFSTEGWCSSNAIVYGTIEQLPTISFELPNEATLAITKSPDDKILSSDEGCYILGVTGPCL